MHRALADPLRIQLLELLWQAPRSVRELAECVALPADRLYYHVGQLEGAKLVEIVEYRSLPKGKVERVYAPAAAEPPTDAQQQDAAGFLGSVLETTRADIAAAYQAKREGRHRLVRLHRGAARLTDEQLTWLQERVDALIDDIAAAGDTSEAGRPNHGGWTRVLFAVVDLQDRATPVEPADTRSSG